MYITRPTNNQEICQQKQPLHVMFEYLSTVYTMIDTAQRMSIINCVYEKHLQATFLFLHSYYTFLFFNFLFYN